jgi:lysylphosphatidylglycerol synthetase-like protein (DUF2156 family)
MNGSASIEQGTTDRDEQRFPWQLGLAAFAWAILGVTAIAMALNSGGSWSEADPSSVGQVRSSLGGSAAVTGHGGGANPAVLVVIGLVVLLLTALLAMGQGWARWALMVLGVAVVIYFAIAAQWQVLIALVVLIVGSVPLLSRSATRYLGG